MMNLPKKILVTGGAGFIGSHTVDALLQRECEVTVLDNLCSGQITNLSLNHPRLSFIEGDILEYPLVQELVSANDAVLHLAAIASVPFSLQEPIYTLQVNTQGHLHLLQAIHSAPQPKKFVYASSAAVYGNEQSMPCNDDEPLKNLGLSPYALQKLHNENYANLYKSLYQQNSIGLRYFNVYGLRQPADSSYSGVISTFIKHIKTHNAINVYGDGSQARDFIAVEDIVQANLLALASNCHGVFNIATGQANTLNQLIELLSKAAQMPVKVDYLAPRPGDIHLSYANTAKALQTLNFQANIPLELGIQKLFNNA